MSDAVFDLVKAKMEQHRLEAMRSLNAALFADGGPHVPVPPLTPRQRTARRLRRLRQRIRDIVQVARHGMPEWEDY
jgi:hypothetical protein